MKKPLVAKQWFDQICRDKRFGLPEPENVYVCNEHFTQDCFETEYRFQLLGGNTRIRSLKTGSVPTILFSTKYLKTFIVKRLGAFG